MESRLIHRVDPEYPAELKEARPSGQVILSIVIGTNGEVQQVEVLKGDEGHAGLNSAAANAVIQWRYKPFVLNGIPVPVKTTVVVRFPRDAFVPQSVKLKNETRSRLESARKELERARSEMAEIDMKEFRRKLRDLEELIERGE